MVYELTWRGVQQESGVTPAYRQAFEWKTEPPTQEGWYWAKGEGKLNQVAEIVRIIDVQGDLFVEHIGWDDLWELKTYTHYLGPIPEPTP